jgi:hypothetical protein
MKRMISLALIIIGATAFIPAQKETIGSLTFKFSTKNIQKGYDHNSKLVIWENDKIIGESTVKPESKANTVTVKLPKGDHAIRAVLNSQYEGTWEEHLIANNYSIDCLYDRNVTVKKKTLVTLVFDIDKGTIIK